MLTAVSRNCWFLFLRVHKKHLSLTENNTFAGIATVAKPRNVKNSKKWFMPTLHYWINKPSKSPEMKSTREIFKTNPSLLDEPEVA